MQLILIICFKFEQITKMNQQILIKVNSENTSDAIKKFVCQFDDAVVEEQAENEDDYYINNYGFDKIEFENQLNVGIAQSILGITKPWNEVKQQLLAKIDKGANR